MLYLYQASWMAILALSKTALTATLGVALETSIAFQNVVLFVCFNATLMLPLFLISILLCAKSMPLPVLWEVFVFYTEICIYSNFMS